MMRTFKKLLKYLALSLCLMACKDDLNFGAKKKSDFKVASSDSPPAEAPMKQFSSTFDYAMYCKSELGLPPEPMKPWNCLDGLEIPITVNGKPLNADNYPKLSSGSVGCDNASWLIPEESCMNYAFVAERNLTPDVKGVIICRNRKYTSPANKIVRRQSVNTEKSVASLIDYYQIDTVGLIWTHMKTGKTCFFDYRGNYGGYIPSPDDTRKPTFADLPEPKFEKDDKGNLFTETIWFNPSNGWRTPQFVADTDLCIRCHDSGPFLSSPWLAQVYSPPRPDKSIPYVIVGGLFTDSQQFLPPTSISTTKVLSPSGKLEDQICTRCHRIGKHFTCNELVPFSIGVLSPQAFPVQNPPLPPIWMPPIGKGVHIDRPNFDNLYAHHMRHLLCCCQNPSAINCISHDVSKDPLGAGIPGRGPGQCP